MPKGRHWFVLWLVVFVAVSGLVMGRQGGSLQTARRLEDARYRRAALEARRADLERQIRYHERRDVLGAKVARELDLRFATDRDIVFLRMSDGSAR